MKTVSILMPAFNASKFIEQAIQSILNQTYSDIELLIADDQSTDDTLAIIERYAKSDKRISVFSNKQNLGYLQTWNLLIGRAKGEYITFQDADDFAAPTRIEKLVNAFKEDPALGVVGSNIYWIDIHNTITKSSDFKLAHSDIVAAMPDSYEFIGSALMIKREAYQSVGGYHPFFDRIGSEDHYWLYLLTEKYKMANVAEPLYYYRFNPHSVMGDISDRPEKNFSSEIVALLIHQRRQTGTDDLNSGNEKKLQQLLENRCAPFREKSYYYWYVAKRRFYEGHKWMAIKILLRAILTAPTKISYYRDLLYYIRNI